MDKNIVGSKSPSIQEEETARRSRSDRDDLHKRKNIKMTSGVYDNRLLRAIKNEERRKSARRDTLNMKRQICDDEDSETEEDSEDTSGDKDLEKHKENKENVCIDGQNKENNCDTDDCEINEENGKMLCKGSLPQESIILESVASNPIDEGSETESVIINDAVDLSTNDLKLKESKKTSEIKTNKVTEIKTNKVTKTANVNLKGHDLKPVKKAPTNDRREKLQQYLAEKKKLAQAKRRIEKPSFRTTGKIQHDLGPIGAHKPNIYSIAGRNKENSSDLTKNVSFLSKKGTSFSRTVPTLSRNVSNVSRTVPNLPRPYLVKNMSRPASISAKNGSALSRSNSTLSRKTLTMIR